MGRCRFRIFVILSVADLIILYIFASIYIQLDQRVVLSLLLYVFFFLTFSFGAGKSLLYPVNYCKPQVLQTSGQSNIKKSKISIKYKKTVKEIKTEVTNIHYYMRVEAKNIHYYMTLFYSFKDFSHPFLYRPLIYFLLMIVGGKFLNYFFILLYFQNLNQIAS